MLKNCFGIGGRNEVWNKYWKDLPEIYIGIFLWKKYRKDQPQGETK